MANLGARVHAAVKAAVGIFSEDSSKQAYGLLAGMWPAGIGDPPVSGARERLGAYADMPWLHALADKVASAFAAVEWQLSYPKSRRTGKAIRHKALQRATTTELRAKLIKQVEPEAEMTPVLDHPMLDLLDGGNALLTGLATRKITALHWDLEGEAFWIKERNPVGAPVAAWPIPPDWVRSTPSPSGPWFTVGFKGWHGRIPETEVLWMPNPNPSNPYGRGSGLARALADELETDEYAAKFTRQTFFNMNRPDFIVYPDEPGVSWTDVERRRLEQDWGQSHQGFWRAFKARFASRKIGVHEFDATDMRTLQMVQLREFQANLVRKIWGVPPEIMGIVEPGASRATAKLASYIFARWVLVPRLEMFRTILQERLVPEYDDRLVLTYVSPVEEDDDFALEVFTANPDVLSVDEWRALGKRPPLKDGEGERYLVRAGVRAVESFDEATPPPPPVVAPPPQPGQGGPPPPKPADPETSARGALLVEEMAVLRRLDAAANRATSAAPSVNVRVEPPIINNVPAPAPVRPVVVRVGGDPAAAPVVTPTQRTYLRDERGLIIGHVDHTTGIKRTYQRDAAGLITGHTEELWSEGQ